HRGPGERPHGEHRRAPPPHGDGAAARPDLVRGAGDGRARGRDRCGLRMRAPESDPAGPGPLALHPVEGPRLDSSSRSSLMSPGPAMRPHRLYAEILLISLAVILLEVSYTRVFSFKLVYYFTYLIIGLAMLGIGAGAALVALFPQLRRVASSRPSPICSLDAGAVVLGGYLVVARTQLNAFHMVESLRPLDLRVVLGEGAKLALICACLFAPFLAAGLALAAIFATRPESFNRL